MTKRKTPSKRIKKPTYWGLAGLLLVINVALTYGFFLLPKPTQSGSNQKSIATTLPPYTTRTNHSSSD